jgi:hypothetical protein
MVVTAQEVSVVSRYVAKQYFLFLIAIFLKSLVCYRFSSFGNIAGRTSAGMAWIAGILFGWDWRQAAQQR